MLRGTLLAAVFLAGAMAQTASPRYLAFQIFWGTRESDALRRAFPPPPADLRHAVEELRDRIAQTGAGDRRLGFVVGPFSFDHTDGDVHDRIVEAFNVALETNVAVGFHLDDSMFWGRMSTLNTVENLEWLDWKRTPNTGRRLDWSATPLKVQPQLCVNSTAGREAVKERAEFLGREITRGVRRLEAAHRGDLFLGIIAGWETQIGHDFDTGKELGYCALTNAGYSADHPPADMDAARNEIVNEFAGLWARTLASTGVPRDKLYSHIAFQSLSTAFCTACVPGLSTYPAPGQLEQWRDELKRHGNPKWASCEGTAIDPGAAGRGGKGMEMEAYLGNLFNHGAQLVNVFGWGVGAPGNPFRKIAESEDALRAYRKFLSGGALAEAPVVMPPDELPGKVRRIQELLPAYVEAHGPSEVAPLMKQLDGYLKQKNFTAAERIADEILKRIATR